MWFPEAQNESIGVQGLEMKVLVLPNGKLWEQQHEVGIYEKKTANLKVNSMEIDRKTSQCYIEQD
jgi:hypothetical protein